MKNITVSVPDDVYRRARIRAAERGTSLSAFVRDLLEGESEFHRLKRLQDVVLESIDYFKAADRLTRDEVHDRDALRRHEHSALRDKQNTR